jgi:hypothetical protein
MRKWESPAPPDDTSTMAEEPVTTPMRLVDGPARRRDRAFEWSRSTEDPNVVFLVEVFKVSDT